MSAIQIESARLEFSPAMNAFGVHVVAESGPHGVNIMQTIVTPVLQHYPLCGWIPPEPAFTLTRQSAQALFDAMWLVGIRPSSGESAGAEQAIVAMREHLADLRRLAFAHLPAPAPATPDRPQSSQPIF